MQPSLDHVAIVGYTALFVFALYKAPLFLRNPVDAVGTMVLLTGLGCLIAYHVRKVATKKDETNDVVQKNVRLIAHGSLVMFLLITLSPMTKSRFQFYDWFALLAHVILFATVLANMNQLGGLGLLAVYFTFAAFYELRLKGMDALQFIGRILMTIFFVTAFVLGIATRV